MSRWFRHYAGMMRDDKLVRVAIRSKQSIERVAWIWGAILESAAEIDEEGRYDVDAAEVAYFLRADQADVDAVLAALADAGRVAGSVVVKWGNRQFSSDRSKDRVAAHRERKRAERDRGNGVREACNADVTLQAQPGNAPETEAKTEVSEAKASSSRAKYPAPAGVAEQIWRDFLASPKRRKAGMNETAYAGITANLRDLAEHGYPPGKMIALAVERGWTTVKLDWVENDERQRTNPVGRHQSSDGLSSTARAAVAVFGR